ncbi:MutS protein msh4 [Madurella fahalii]|uniref:MutS protein msh4 n=1 Tax=Madurella fahalii TaxID=1157608 RepID=A0ABQ0FYW6_9PEZI
MDSWAGADFGPLEPGTDKHDQFPTPETPRHSIKSQRFSRPGPGWLRKRAISGAIRNATNDTVAHPSSNYRRRRAVTTPLTQTPGGQVYPVPASSSEGDSESIPMSPTDADSSSEERPQITARLPGAYRWGDYYDMDGLRSALETDGYWETRDTSERQSILTRNLPAYRKHNLNSDFAPAPERWLRQGIRFEFDYAYGLREEAAQHPKYSELQPSSPPIRSANGERLSVFSSSLQQDPDERDVAVLGQGGPDESDYKHTTLQRKHTPIKMLTQQSPPPPIHDGLQRFNPTIQRFSRGSSRPSVTDSNSDDWLLPHPFKHNVSLPCTRGTPYEGSGIDVSLDIPVGSAVAETPRTPTRGSRHNSAVRSPYFQKGEGLSEIPRSLGTSQTPGPSGSTGIGSSFDSPLSSSPHQNLLGNVSPGFARLQLDPCNSETNDSKEEWTGLQHGLWGHQHDHSFQTGSPNELMDPESHQSVQQRSNSESPLYSLAPSSQNSSPWAQDSFHPDHVRSYTPQVCREELNPQMTQTITPQPSPHGSKPNPFGIREGINGRHKRRDGFGRGSFRSILSHSQPDSSILSPLKRKTGGPIGVHSDTITLGHSALHDHPATQPLVGAPSGRPRGDLHARVWDECHSETETANLAISDVGLGSDSENDTEDDRDVDNSGFPAATLRTIGGMNSRTPSASTEEDCVVCAISESRSSDVIGLAIINIGLGQVNITRILNDDRYQRLMETIWRMPAWPQIFLVLKKVVAEQSKSLLACYLKQHFPDAEVVPLDRAHWNESEGLRMIDRFAWRKDIKAIRSNLEHNFYASCAFSAVMAYVEDETDVVFRENSLNIKYIQPVNTMGLDRSTVTALELLQNIRHSKRASSTLFGLLNNTLTPQGRRLVRSTLLQPSMDRSVITMRHEAVEELSSNEDLFTEVRRSLKNLLHIDIERTIPWVARPVGKPRLPLQDGVAMVQGQHQIVMPSHEELQAAEKDLNHILMIKAFLGGVQILREVLEVADCASQSCKWVLEQCGPENTANISALIAETIEQDAIYSKAPIDIRNNRMWAVKAEPNSVLERARQLYRERTNEMHDYMEGLSKTFQAAEHMGSVPELRLANDNHYYLRFQWSDVERDVMRHLGSRGDTKFIGVQHWRQRSIGGVEIVNGSRRKQHYYCQTVELIQMSSQIQRQADIVTAHSDQAVVELKTSLLDHAGSLRALSEATALLDMLASFAHLATTQNYVRPIISENLVLKAARNPIVEVRKPNFVSNDVYSGDRDARFQVITGGNMSGKSTFVRSIALIQVMAQIGSFVPAQYAAIPICDRLFTRLSTEDKPENNLGTFAVEMTEMNMILRQATKDSMIIIDELGRGTSTKEGVAIAFAMSEQLIEKGCRVFFATHFTELAKVLNCTKQSSVLNVHITGESTRNGEICQISLPHTVASGPVRNEDYGLDLARRFLPERVVNNAERICKFLRDIQASKPTGPTTRSLTQNKLLLALPDLLKQAHSSTMDESALASYLKKLQTEFTIRMNTVADDDTESRDYNQSANLETEHPALEKPDEDELQRWKKKCDAAERRVMHANMVQSQERKRPAAREKDKGGLRKRNKTDAATESLSTPTPINRGSIIKELRIAACSSRNMGDTSSNFTADLPELVTEGVPELEGEVSPAGRTWPGNLPGWQQKQQRAVSISTDDSNHEDTIVDTVVGHGQHENVAETGEIQRETIQPLQRFEPLKDWYSRKSREADACPDEPGNHTTPTTSARSRSGTQEFLRSIEDDEDE